MRHISECLPAELIGRLNEMSAGTGAAITALRPGPHSHRDETAAALEFVATSRRVGRGQQPVAFAQSGEGTVAQTAMKNGRAVKPGRVNREVVSEDRSRGEGLMSTRKHMLTVLPAASESQHRVARCPTRSVGSHLKLVVIDGRRVA